MIPVQQEDQKCPACDQDYCRRQYQFCMKGKSADKIFSGSFSFQQILHMLDHFPPDGEAKSAQDNQSHGCNIHQRIGYKRRKRRFTYQIDSCIAKRGYRMENTVPDSSPQSIMRNKPKAITYRSCNLNHRCSDQESSDNSHASFQHRQIICILNQFATLQADFSSQNQKYHDHTCHDSKPAKLNQPQNHNFSKHAPGGCSGHGHKAGYTHRCSRRK